MKKWLLPVLSLLLSLSLLSCSSTAEKEEMYIETASLTEEEESLAKLLGLGDGRYLYDFSLDDTVKSMQIAVYEWQDSRWQPMSNGFQKFTDQTGRLALGYDKIAEGVSIALQSEHYDYTESTQRTPDYDLSALSTALTDYADEVNLTYEEELPLAVQVLSDADSCGTFGYEVFDHPEVLAQYEDARAYAITITVSQKTPAELEA